jgi:multicomponent Na+:H+ antiporter subunit E
MTSRGLRLRVAIRVRLLPIGWLTLVWVLLWGTFSAANILSGIALGIVVTTVLPLPTVRLGGRLHPWASAKFAAHFAFDLVRASAQVALTALRPGPPPPSSIVAVRMCSRSELHLALTAQAISLTPGSLVVELDPDSATIWTHVLGAGDDAAVDRYRAHVAELEARIIHAVGSRSDLALLQSESSGGAR